MLLAGSWLLAVAAFKLGDALASKMIGPLLKDGGMSLTDIGVLTGSKVLAEELLRAQAKRNRALVRNLTKDGRVIWCEWYNSAFFDAAGRLASVLSFAEDVTARVEAEEQLQKLAVNDALTGLPNRNSLANRLEHAILRVNRSGDRVALLFIDLDRFKNVNDTMGHDAGDHLLVEVADRLRGIVRATDTVARLGGWMPTGSSLHALRASMILRISSRVVSSCSRADASASRSCASSSAESTAVGVGTGGWETVRSMEAPAGTDAPLNAQHASLPVGAAASVTTRATIAS